MNKNITLGIIFLIIIVSTFWYSNILEGLADQDPDATIKEQITEFSNRQNNLSKSYEETSKNKFKKLPNLTELAKSYDNIKNSFTRYIDMDIVTMLSGYNGADPKDLDNLDNMEHYKATKEILQKPENQQLLIICSALHAMSDSKDLFETNSGGMFGSGDSDNAKGEKSGMFGNASNVTSSKKEGGLFGNVL